MKYQFIAKHRKTHSVEKMARMLGVSRSGYYGWLGKPRSDRNRRDEELVETISSIRKDSKGRYGSPRVTRELKRRGHRGWTQPRGSSDEGEWSSGPSQTAVSVHDELRSYPSGGRERPEPAIRRHRAECRVGERHHLRCAWPSGAVGDGILEQEHVWNTSIRNKEVNADVRPLLREGESRSGGDLPHAGRVT